MGKLSLYFNTIKYMKPGQITARIGKKIGGGCALDAAPSLSYDSVLRLESPEALDFDSVFLSRFPVEKLMNDRISFLHSEKEFDWTSNWEFKDKSPLWNFNLHYFEYLFPLINAWRETGERKYLDKTTSIIDGWIENNAKGAQPGWAAYTTALRLVNWISYYGYVCDHIDESFKNKFLDSLHSQYAYLSRNLEKDILGNHYFEDLKSLVMASLFFNDEVVFEKALKDFKAECREQILPDGMHFELSPMYHKIMFEGVLRVNAALMGAGKSDPELESYLQVMLNAAYSLERGLERVPLFNDGGNNVAKSLEALISASDQLFGLKPVFSPKLEDSGFYIFEKVYSGHSWKLIVDAGKPGPDYIPGHAHCDAMSFELFRDGKPVLVNCGTYAYQCAERGLFRSTAAHNTVMINDTEQSRCWSAFRLAERSSIRVVSVTDDSITMEMKDQKGQLAERTIAFTEGGLTVKDVSVKPIKSYVHFAREEYADMISCAQDKVESKMPYAPEYGEKLEVLTHTYCSDGVNEMLFDFSVPYIADIRK